MADKNDYDEGREAGRWLGCMFGYKKAGKKSGVNLKFKGKL
ncbi:MULTISPECIES: hypothetical protein [unclassified Campylobacter]|nr:MULTISPECIES: hypothetical protein [unclassified Campylobacter]MDA3062382.1 hypothetical protein [Campylobacter sp. JMF_14 EL1]MDA3073499.1 hypothetical protein [Campylobacter sp. JMF_10 EL2]MDA3077495.1 hypothetical protein [Campylobacter sp. JMF_06 NA1]